MLFLILLDPLSGWQHVIRPHCIMCGASETLRQPCNSFHILEQIVHLMTLMKSTAAISSEMLYKPYPFNGLEQSLQLTEGRDWQLPCGYCGATTSFTLYKDGYIYGPTFSGPAFFEA